MGVLLMNIKFIKKITCFTDFFENMFSFIEILITINRTSFIGNRINFLYVYETYMHKPLMTITQYELKFNSFLKLNQNTREKVI